MNSACEQSQLDRVKSNSKLYFKFASSISGAQMQGSQIVHLPMLVNPKAAPAASWCQEFCCLSMCEPTELHNSSIFSGLIKTRTGS